MKKAILITCLINFAVNLAGQGDRPRRGRGDGPRRIENPQTLTLSRGSRVEFKSFHSPALGKAADFSIFFPPTYDRDNNRRFPAVYFLHGLWNDHTSWTVGRYGGIPQSLENLMVEGKIPEFVLIHPNGENSFYTDYLDGSRRYEEMVAVDLIGHVESNYRVLSNRQNRALGGVSMGGYGSLKIGMKYPKKFGSVVGISPIVFTGKDPSAYFRNSSSRLAQYLSSALEPIYGIPFDADHWNRNSLEIIAASTEPDGMNIFFAFGTADRYNQMFPLESGIRLLSKTLQDRRVEHVYRIYENGPHGWQLVVDHLEEVAEFLCQTF